MSIVSEIDRIIGLVSESHEAVKAKGGTTAAPYTIGKLPGAIESIPEAKDPVLQEKDVTPKTTPTDVTPDSGYDGLSKVTVKAMPTATQATPSITVGTDGKITASATQAAGYVAAGTKSSTKQLTTKGADIITPGTTNQTIAAGTYCSGTQTIKGDTNLTADNIKSGVSIFGVEGSYEGSGSGGANTVNVRVQGGALLGFDVNGNAVEVEGGRSCDFLGGIAYAPISGNVSYSGTYIRHPRNSFLFKFVTDGVYTISTSGGGGGS